MPKKTLKILIIILFAIVIGLFIAAFFISKDGTTGDVSSIGDNGIFGGFFSGSGGDSGSSGGIGGSGSGGSSGSGGGNGSLFEDGRDGGEKKLPVLRKITDGPVSGAVIFDRDKNTLVRYMEKATGHIYEVNIKETNPVRISNTTVPRVYETLWSTDGKLFVARYLDDETEVIKSFGGSVNTETNELDGAFLVDGINQMAISQESNRVFYLSDSGDGGVNGIASGFRGEDKSQIFSSEFSEWLFTWPRVRNVALTTKPSSGVPGSMYFLNTQNGAFDKILGDINGLTTATSPNTSRVLYSESLRTKTIKLRLYDVPTDKAKDIDVVTLPEKCVWTSDSDIIYCGVPTIISRADYPDEWYQGLVSFADDVWKIDIKNGFVDLLAIPVELVGEEVDLINPILSPNEDYVIFTNKKDSSLWSLSLTE